MATSEPFVLDTETPLGFRARCSAVYWDLITAVKDPVMRGRLADVQQTLTDPEHVRRSGRDADVLLFYRRDVARWVCVVVVRKDGVGYVITAYPADTVKAGETIWTK